MDILTLNKELDEGNVNRINKIVEKRWEEIIHHKRHLVIWQIINNIVILYGKYNGPFDEIPVEIFNMDDTEKAKELYKEHKKKIKKEKQKWQRKIIRQMESQLKDAIEKDKIELLKN